MSTILIKNPTNTPHKFSPRELCFLVLSSSLASSSRDAGAWAPSSGSGLVPPADFPAAVCLLRAAVAMFGIEEEGDPLETPEEEDEEEEEEELAEVPAAS